MFVNQFFTLDFPPETVGGRWKMRVEDKRAENAIFHQVILLIIRMIIVERWKMEDWNAFFV
ncbi:hypothetical protein E7X19_08360 [Bacteroides fragilis]|nr:hypothetical protein E7X03_01040 [Bacteroides fragilis]THC74868.1 hypothetical protein E7X19_08360 [Bacteroides fragilis]THC86754.1 hypothetical protein E7X23_01040 [Bacteroides fragilis]